MYISQVCAYANWTTESLEVWKWCSRGRPSNDVFRDMESLFYAVFSKVVIEKSVEDLEKASRTIGMTYDKIELTEKNRDLLKIAFYTQYMGKCLDKDRLQYFAPNKILKHGTVKLQNNRMIINPMKIPKNIELDDSVETLLLIRRYLGDDPNRIEADRLRASLGKEWNYLFNWKREFNLKW